jgi:hypothetical protein
MISESNPLERAYELARSGIYADMQSIIRRLKAEGFDQVEAHLAGRGIRAELRNLLLAARADPAAR